MVTNPGEEERETFAEAFPGFFREVVTGSESGSIRAVVLMLIVGVCTALAPLPANVIGIVALILLAMSKWVIG